MWQTTRIGPPVCRPTGRQTSRGAHACRCVCPLGYGFWDRLSAGQRSIWLLVTCSLISHRSTGASASARLPPLVEDNVTPQELPADERTTPVDGEERRRIVAARLRRMLRVAPMPALTMPAIAIFAQFRTVPLRQELRRRPLTSCGAHLDMCVCAALWRKRNKRGWRLSSPSEQRAFLAIRRLSPSVALVRPIHAVRDAFEMGGSPQELLPARTFDDAFCDFAEPRRLIPQRSRRLVQGGHGAVPFFPPSRLG